MSETAKNAIKMKVVVAASVVMVVGIMVALPILMYPAYAERAYRTEVLNGINRIYVAQEQFRVRNGTYTNDRSALGFANGCTENCVYLVTVEGANTQTFRARFVPNPAGGTNDVNQSGDEGCGWFTIDSIGFRAAENQNCLEGR